MRNRLECTMETLEQHLETLQVEINQLESVQTKRAHDSKEKLTLHRLLNSKSTALLALVNAQAAIASYPEELTMCRINEGLTEFKIIPQRPQIDPIGAFAVKVYGYHRNYDAEIDEQYPVEFISAIGIGYRPSGNIQVGDECFTERLDTAHQLSEHTSPQVIGAIAEHLLDQGFDKVEFVSIGIDRSTMLFVEMARVDEVCFVASHEEAM